MTKMLTKYYRIPTSLSIAVARVAEMMPRACVLPEGIATLTLERQDQDEARYLVLRPTEYLTTCGAWQVRVTPDAMRWTHAGAQVTLTPDGETAFAGSDAREKRALRVVRARLPQLKLPDYFWAWRLDVRMVAVTPTETIAAWWTLRMLDVAQQLEQRVKVLWQAREAEAELVALLRDLSKSYEEIAEELHCSVETVKRKARELQAAGLVPRRKWGRKGVKSVNLSDLDSAPTAA
jgi:DNA-binding CsgD family transcriptional regulator